MPSSRPAPAVEARLGRVLPEQAVAEAVEVVHPQAARPLDTEGPLEALHQLARSADVVGQDEDVLRRQRTVAVEQMADPLDDHGGLAGAGSREHHQRPVAPLDGGPLRWRRLERGRSQAHRLDDAPRSDGRADRLRSTPAHPSPTRASEPNDVPPGWLPLRFVGASADGAGGSWSPRRSVRHLPGPQTRRTFVETRRGKTMRRPILTTAIALAGAITLATAASAQQPSAESSEPWRRGARDRLGLRLGSSRG